MRIPLLGLKYPRAPVVRAPLCVIPIVDQNVSPVNIYEGNFKGLIAYNHFKW